MSRVIALIGDHFITPDVLKAPLSDQIKKDYSFAECTLEWPDVPFHQTSGPAGAEISEYSGDPEYISSAIIDAEACLTHLAPLTRSALEAAPYLEFIGVARGSLPNLNVEAAEELGITVANVPGRNAAAVSEFVIGVILAQTRLITESHYDLRQGRWRGDLYRADCTGTELSGLTVGIVGYGNIGQRVARLLKPFGCRILVTDPFASLSIHDTLDGVQQVSLDELLACSDVVTLHVRATETTRHMINAESIQKMKPGSYLINTARGALIDHDALCDGLRTQRLKGAALDTFPSETIDPSDPLLAFPNVTVTPHIAGASVQVAEHAASTLAAEIQQHFTGRSFADSA